MTHALGQERVAAPGVLRRRERSMVVFGQRLDRRTNLWRSPLALREESSLRSNLYFQRPPFPTVGAGFGRPHRRPLGLTSRQRSDVAWCPTLHRPGPCRRGAFRGRDSARWFGQSLMVPGEGIGPNVCPLGLNGWLLHEKMRRTCLGIVRRVRGEDA
jgi:hypothetical protein